MTKFKKLVLALLALLATTFPQAAFALGESLTPNTPGRFYSILVNRIGLTAADAAIMDQVETKIGDFRIWTVSLEPAVSRYPGGVIRRVTAGAYSVNAIGHVTWPNSFNSTPVGNICGDTQPHVPAGPLPAWLATYPGVVSNAGTIPDTAWQTITTNKIVSTLQLDRTSMQLMTVTERFSLSTDTPSHLSGRSFTVNPDLWAAATESQRTAWVNRVMLLALNVGLYAQPANVSSLLHLTAPSETATIPVVDRDRLIVTWAGTLGGTIETAPYPMPVQFSPVP